MAITLEAVAGPLKGKAFSFDRHSTFLVGRSADAAFSLPDDDYLSRVHFLVEVNPPLAHLTDLGSRNGTKVNGQRRADAPLRDGDVIDVGTTRLLVAMAARPGDAETRDLPASAARDDAEGVTRDLPAETEDRPASEMGLLTSTQAPSATTSPTTRGAGRLPAFPGYAVLERLGGGGMGDVYRAAREADGKAVAVKTIKPAVTPTADTVGRFIREADILRRLTHPNVVGFEEFGEANGLLFFVMELVTGRDAAACVKDAKKAGRPLPLADVRRIAAGLLAGLAAAHRAGYIHRDIKPGNVLVADDGAVKVADFGLARAYQESPLSGLTLSGRSMGTPAFMPPEQVRDFRTVKPAGDQYSAAATIYYLLTGENPHGAAANASEMFRKLLTEPAPSALRLRPDAPAAMAAAVAKGMAIRPEDRHADVDAFAKAMN